MPSIVASLPFAHHQIDTGIREGGVHRLTELTALLMGALKVTVLKDENHKEQNTDDEKCDDIYPCVRARAPHLSAPTGITEVGGNAHPVFQPLGATFQSLRMKMMNVKPTVTRNAPSQSMRLLHKSLSVQIQLAIC